MLASVSNRPGTDPGRVLAVGAGSQFLVSLDSSVTTSMLFVASDVGTSIWVSKRAITLYTFDMASMMILGHGRHCLGPSVALPWACSSRPGLADHFLAPRMGMLRLGWSLLEQLSAALIRLRRRGPCRGGGLLFRPTDPHPCW
jgi:hypothetical protein